MNKTYIVTGVIIVLVILIIAFLLLGSNNQSRITNESIDESQSTPISNQINNEVVEEAVESIELTAVAPYSGSGTANRSFNETNFVHLVVAQLDNPGEGKFYEGWLVNMSLDPPFFSTGRLEKEGGDYALLYTSETDYSDYNQVVITEETESLGLDGKPEAHVLEGSF